MRISKRLVIASLALAISVSTPGLGQNGAQSPSDRVIIIPQDAQIQTPDGRSFNYPNPTDIFPVREFTPQNAIEIFQQSLVSARQAGDSSSEAIALLNLANAYSSLGHFGEKDGYYRAIDLLQQSLTIRQQLNDLMGEAITLHNLGDVYYSLGDWTQAIASYEQALEIAKTTGDRFLEGDTLGALGLVYGGRGDYTRAIEFIQQSYALAKGTNDLQMQVISLNNLGYALYQAGKLPESAKTLFASIEIWRSLRQKVGATDAQRVAIGELQINTYRLLQKVLREQNRTSEALEVAEAGRSRAFVDLLARSAAGAGSLLTINPPSIKEIQEIAKQQKATVVEYSIIFEQYRDKGAIKAKESEIFIWVVKPNGEVAFRSHNLDTNISLKNLVPDTLAYMGVRSQGQREIKEGDLVRLSGDPADWRREVVKVDRQNNTVTLKFFSDPADAPTTERPIKDIVEKFSSPQTTIQGLEQLHELLISPIAELLPTDENARVIFIPQSELFLVPFPALRDKAGKYLIEKHTILTSSAIQVLELTRKARAKVRQAALQDAVVVGNPTMPSIAPAGGNPVSPPLQLAALPEAEKEALAIADLLNTQPMIGNKATKAAIIRKLPLARYIHLATHGLFDERWGLGSAIALAPSGNDDGFLTAEDLLRLKLNAELVFLSACNTGKGRITGDGVIGLSRSLISAGVPSVIVSLWQVPDAPTASLTIKFYQNLQKRQDKATALRQAMLETMKQHPSPKDWAAFTLIGEAE